MWAQTQDATDENTHQSRFMSFIDGRENEWKTSSELRFAHPQPRSLRSYVRSLPRISNFKLVYSLLFIQLGIASIPCSVWVITTKPNQTKPLEEIVYARSIGERGWVISIPSTWFNIWLFICSYVFTTHTVYTSARSTHFVNECERKNMQSALKERELTRAYARSSHPIRIDRVWILYLLLCAHQRIFDFAPVQNIFYGRKAMHTGRCVCVMRSRGKNKAIAANYCYFTANIDMVGLNGMRKRISKGECRKRLHATCDVASKNLNYSIPLLSKWCSTQKCFATVTVSAKHFGDGWLLRAILY